MKKFPIVTTVPSTIQAVTEAYRNTKSDIVIQTLSSYEEAVSVFKYEMPEIKIIDFGDPAVDAKSCLKIITDDPWLLFGGVIAITNTASEKATLERQKEPNFLFVATREDFENHSSQIIKIIDRHQHFLFNRGMHNSIEEHEHGNFISNTDPFEIIFYTSLIGTYLYNTNRINDSERTSFQNAMMELLLNAIEHGNCNISYEEKTAWLSQGKNMLDLIAIKQKEPEISKKKVYITYDITPERTQISIRDEGKGFDWRSRLKAEFKPDLHGMGIKIIQNFIQNLRYNDIGNEVSFEIPNQKNVANLTPAILKSQKMLTFKHMQVVCKENEESNHLFYICSGRYAVYVDNKLLSVLTPADIFIGEMAFLLNDKRSATIVAIGEGTLVSIPKMQFMHLIEEYPHYGIFLSRLLAARLAKQSKDAAKLKNQVRELGEKNPKQN
ncbi:cyclic nucleotide-binding protein [Treponema phagedenis]|uniref:Cyclic nucleotide-binding domain protein n=1 Tax=Treponema phagedenis TaxID=162 RepID=A0A0B7GSZ0_TREPH|nr:cyclic nucleotide-binding domain-containing protein [Treponema phagedenis]EFW38851.1 cyclic nucleotide-binding domain protein [Treponema phagedenis F0421]NVP25199.1 cyclic nucleotide-binding domain-containing protein [Treponema phagedenis]QEJ95941.1 cyclic nucleotide-binding domain-containing protein [Treponema phagedenis]QEJ97315.1 cyclic nucleotide-binding domain-containing protein [Treponema phagedenis]QEK00360.1 cyclic nucleotide-binding domain-containing protein [Treponema phagedenis]